MMAMPPRRASTSAPSSSSASSSSASALNPTPAFRCTVLLACACLLLWRLGYAPLWNPDEGRYAAASLEMARPFDGRASDWVVPHLNTVPRLNKPPLVYWAAASSFRLFGPSAWAARLVPALCAIGVMLLVWAMARRAFGERAGLISALVWATSLLPFALGRTLNTDMLLTAAMTLALFGIFSMQKEKGKGQKAGAPTIFAFFPFPFSFCIAGLGMGAALLAKGPVGMALPLAIGFVFLGVTRPRRAVPWRDALLACALAVAVAAPWYVAVAAREPQFLKNFLLGENLNRFSGKTDFHDATPFWFYAPIVLLGLIPWTALLPLSFARLRLAAESVPAQWLRRALWLLAVLLLLVFLPRLHREPALIRFETQRFYLRIFNTLLPLMLFLPLLVRLRLRDEHRNGGDLNSGRLDSAHIGAVHSEEHSGEKRWAHEEHEDAAPARRDALCFLWLWALFLIGLFSLSSTKLGSYVLPAFPALAMLLGEAIDSLFARAGAAAPAAPAALSFQATPGATARFALAGTLFLNLALAIGAARYLTSGKTLPLAEGQSFAWGCGVILAAGSALAALAWHRRDIWRIVRAQMLTFSALYLSLLSLAGRIALYEDASPMFIALRPHLRPDDRFVQYQMAPQFTSVFYLGRPTEFMNFLNNSGLDNEAITASKLFLPGGRDAVRRLFAGPQRVFMLTRRHREPVPLPHVFHLVARNNDFAIFSNRAPPAGFDYQFVAPGKK